MKPPAFQFYPDDFLGGVADMTQAEVGAYILLLCHQWSRGEIPADAQRASLVAKGEVSDHVMGKFPAGKNERLESERRKQDDYRQKQADKGRASAQARFNRGSTAVQPSGQPEGNSPSPSPISSLLIEDKRRFAPPALDEVKQFASEIGMAEAEAVLCWNYYEANGWKVGRNPMKSWPAAVRGWHGRAGNFTKAQPSSPAALSPAARAFALSKELERVEVAIKDLDRQSYEPSGLSDAERATRKQLRAKRDELRKELNL